MPPRGRGSSPPVVVSVGGSVFLSGEDDAKYLQELSDLLVRVGRSTPLVVTVGGGRTARAYIRLGRALGLTDVELDELGIDVTRIHARLLAGRIGLPTPSHPPASVREAVEAVRHASPVVLGGTEPGHTTDAVAALIAVRLRAARVVNATDVDGVYDADPGPPPVPGAGSGARGPRSCGSSERPRPTRRGSGSLSIGWERRRSPAQGSPWRSSRAVTSGTSRRRSAAARSSGPW